MIIEDKVPVLASALAALALSGSFTCSAAVIYTFEAPQFTVGENTPLLNRSTNVGDPSFLTSFTHVIPAGLDENDPGGAKVANQAVNSLMVGQFLLENLGSTGPLTLTFNRAVSQITLDFALKIPNTAPLGGFLRLIAASTTVNQASAVVGGGASQGGTLSFVSGTPFLSATLQGFNSGGVPVELAMDRLTLEQAVPSRRCS